LVKDIVENDRPEDSPEYAMLEKTVKDEPQLEHEIKASQILNVVIELLREQHQFEPAMYGLETLGEIYATVDIFPDSIRARSCVPTNVYFLAGDNKLDISTSPGIVEDIQWSIYSLFDNFRLSTSAAKKLRDLIKDVEKVSTGSGNAAENTSTPVYRTINPYMLNSEASIDKIFFMDYNRSAEMQDFDPMSLQILVQKVTTKRLRKRFKVFSTIVDIDENNYRIESSKYIPLPHEKAITEYETYINVAYYVPAIDEEVYSFELHNELRTGNKGENAVNLYSGFIHTVNGLSAHSGVKAIRPLVHAHSAVYHNILQLIVDNLGNLLVIEEAAIPEEGYEKMLRSIVYNKIITVNSAAPIVDEDGVKRMLAEISRRPVEVINMDNSSNILALFRTAYELEQAIITGKGTSQEAMGNIQQNARVGNVDYAAQQGVFAQADSLRLYYNTFGALYQNTLDIIRKKNEQEPIDTGPLLGNKIQGARVLVGKNELAGSLRVNITTAFDTLRILDELHQRAADALHQGRTTLSEYVKIRTSRSIQEITEKLTKSAEAEQAAAQQQMQQQQEAAQQAAQEVKAFEIEKIKAELASKEAIAKDENLTRLQIAADKNKTDLAIAKLNLEKENGRTRMAG